MKAASTKKFVAMLASLYANLPADEVDQFPDALADEIIRGAKSSGPQFMRFLKNGARVHVVGNHEIDCDAEPFCPEGLSVAEGGHKKGGILKWDPASLRLHLSPNQQGVKVIEGNKLRKELEGEPVLNANVLDYLLLHTELIPEECKGRAVFFWGTIYRGSDGDLCVRYLCWVGKQWISRCNWLDDGWNDIDPALLSASA